MLTFRCLEDHIIDLDSGGGEGSTINGGNLSTWGLLSLPSLNSVMTTSKGYDALVAYAPASKIENTAPTTDAKPVSILSTKNHSAITPEESQYQQGDNSEQEMVDFSSTMSPEMPFHLCLRIKENEIPEKCSYNPASPVNKDAMPCNGSSVKLITNSGNQITAKSIRESSKLQS